MKIQTFNKIVLFLWIIFLGILIFSANAFEKEHEKLKDKTVQVSLLNENIYDFLIISGEFIAFPKSSSFYRWKNKHKDIANHIDEIINKYPDLDKRAYNRMLVLNDNILKIFNRYSKYYKEETNNTELSPFLKIQASTMLSLLYEMNKIALSEKKKDEKLITQMENDIKKKVNIVLLFIVIFLIISFIYIWVVISSPITKISKQISENENFDKIKLLDSSSKNEIGIFVGAFNNLIKKRIIWEKKLLSTEKSLKEQKNELETVFENVNDGIAILDLNLKFIRFNRAYLAMTGFTKEKLLQMTCIEITAPEDIESTKEALNLVFKEGSIENFEKTCIVKDEKRILVSMNINLLPDKKRLLISTKDITTLKILEEQSKMASMGEMIGNIAHQWRQPLSIISTCATGMKFQKEVKILSDSEFYNNCDLINKNVQFLSTTIDDFKNFIKENKEKRVFKISDNIKQFLSLIEGSMKQNSIKINIDIEDMEINGYDNELIQCYMNLFNNSKDAFIENSIENRLIHIKTVNQGHNLLISFRDNAHGIDERIINRVFEPYFTTKHKFNGTGLGLHMTYNMIVNGMDGTIKVSNIELIENAQSYKGAEFLITIPKNIEK